MFWMVLGFVYGKCSDHTELRRPYFGDLHVHTHYSMDAAIQGTVTTHQQAYDFAKGMPLELPNIESELQLSKPLDFVSITDHSEMLGEIEICRDSDRPGHWSLSCILFRNVDDFAYLFFNSGLARRPKSYKDGITRLPFCGLKSQNCNAVAREVWEEQRALSEYNYEECSFTTFPGYEWTSSPHLSNLHRNVIFKNGHVPSLPISYYDASTPERLWRRLEEECSGDCSSLTIPHNSNISGGKMFIAYDSQSHSELERYALSRAEHEPLIEIFQHKGSSECFPNGVDEQCDFEYTPFDNLIEDRYNGKFTDPPTEKDSVRWALKEGLRYEDVELANPYQYGIIASTDTHLGAAGAAQEQVFLGHGGAGKIGKEGLVDSPYFNPGGLAVVYAEENSRASIFEGMRRKETYGTSGPRIELRFFASEEPLSAECGTDAWIEEGYQKGVAMGGGLTGSQMRYHINVKADPLSAPISTIELYKGWIEEGETREAIYSVWKEEGGNEQVCLSWLDENHNEQHSSFVYVRVLEIPSVRWSKQACLEQDCPEEIPDVVQERAWSSPIFHKSGED
ncbi:MAG: hypothetical protein CMK59_14845 [Proteobacteria bacterium]|nr:hypothetical protein [Pseudomonadota bacterium]